MKYRILISIFLAVFFSTVFHRTCFTQMDKVRVRLLEQPVTSAQDGTVILPFETAPRFRQPLQFLALTADSANRQQHSVTIVLNAQPVGHFVIPSGGTVECTVDISRLSPLKLQNILKLQAGEGGWTLETLELKNMRSYSTGMFSFFVVAKDFSEYSRPSFAGSVTLGIVLFLPGLLFDLNRRLLLLLKVSGLLASGAVLLFNLLAPDALLIAIQTWLATLTAVYLPELLSAFGSFRRVALAKSPRIWAAMKILVVLTAVFAYFCGVMLYFLGLHRNYSGFLYLSEKYIKGNPLLRDQKELKEQLELSENGYDAQFMYTIAFDPFLNEFKDKPKTYLKVVDNPPYRYARIGYPLLTKLFSLDKPELYPRTMIYLILASHLVAALFLTYILRFYNRDPFWALLYLLVPGFPLSLMFGLPESIAAAFLLGGFWFYLKQRPWTAAGFLAASILVRETGVLLVLCLPAYEWWKKANRRTGIILACSLVPYLFWRFFLIARLSKQFGLRTLYTGGDLALPFSGMWQACNLYVHGQYSNGVAGPIYAVILLSALLVSGLVFRKLKNVAATCFLFSALLAVSLSYHKIWLALPNVERVTYEVFLFSLVTLVAPEVWNSKLKYAILGIFAALFFYSYFFATTAGCFRQIIPLHSLG